MVGFCVGRAYTGLGRVSTATMSYMNNSLLAGDLYPLSASGSSSAAPSSTLIPQPLGEGHVAISSLGWKDCVQFYSLNLDQLWASVFITIQYENKSLGWQLSDTQCVYQYYYYANVIPMGKTGRPFVVSLVLCPLIRIIVVDCPLEPMPCLATVLGPDNGDRHGFQCVNQALNTTKSTWLLPWYSCY